MERVEQKSQKKRKRLNYTAAANLNREQRPQASSSALTRNEFQSHLASTNINFGKEVRRGALLAGH